MVSSKDYKQTEVGVIPKEWHIGTIEDFGKVLSGGTPSTNVLEYWGGSYLWCTPSDITCTSGKYIVQTERKITEQGLKNSSAYLMPKGSLLLCTRATIGEMKINLCPMATNQGFKNVLPNGKNSINFLYYLLHTKKQKMVEKAIGSTFLELSKGALCSIPLQIPLYEEQKNIAKVLSDIDNLISTLEKQIAKKKAIKQGVMQELITGKKRLKGFDKEWSVYNLEDLCHLITKQTGFDYTNEIKSSLIKVNIPGTIPFIQNKDFEGNKVNLKTDYFIPINTAKKYPKIMLDETCMLISLSGRIGNVGVYNRKYGHSFIGGAVGICKFYNPDYAEWAMLYLSTEEGQKQIFEKQKAGAQHNLTVADVRKLSIKLPQTMEEIKGIVYILSDIEQDIIRLEEKHKKYTAIKQGMMEQLLTGKIRLV